MTKGSSKRSPVATRSLRSRHKIPESKPLSLGPLENLAHELRSSLTFISGYIELMRGGALGEIAPSAREGLDAVSDKMNGIVRRLNDLLLLERADALQMGRVNVSEVARASLRGAKAAAQRAGIALREEIAPVPTIAGDELRLGQVFDNLLDNAIKYSPNVGEVFVRVHDDQRLVQVQVEDHGIGIPRDQWRKIFGRFYQVNNPTTRKYRGAGLGLAIVKRIVRAHRGRVWVESEEGTGSTFYFTLPIIQPRRTRRAQRKK